MGSGVGGEPLKARRHSQIGSSSCRMLSGTTAGARAVPGFLRSSCEAPNKGLLKLTGQGRSFAA
jgi:hypothetical protein